MKAFKKLVPAVALLLVSAVLLGTSTYAWFSMNKEVTASTMTINATAENPFLQITDTSGDEAVYATSATLTASAKDLNLVTPLNVASNVAYYASSEPNSTTTTPEKFTTSADVLWGTAVSTETDEVQADNVPTQVGSKDLSSYVLSQKLWVKVATNSADGENLKLSSVEITDSGNSILEAARVLVVTETGKYMIYDAGTKQITGDSALAEKVTTDAVQLTVYFYFDGTDDVAYTDAATTFANVVAKLTFSID